MQQYIQQLNQQYPKLAYICATIAYVTLAFMQIINKQLSSVISPFAIYFYRAFALFLISLILLNKSNQNPYIKNSDLFKSVIKRLCFSVIFVSTMYYCVKYIPVSTNLTLQNTAPIFAFFVQAVFFNKPFNKIRLGLTCICFVGIVLVLQPSFIFHNNSTGPFKTSFEILVSLFSIFGAFCFSMTMVYVHDQSSKLSSMINLHYTYMSQMCFSGLVMNIMHSTIAFNEITYLDITLFFILVGISLIAQYMIYTANSLKKPSRTMPFGYVGVLAGFLADVFYFDIDFNLLSIIGMILTSIGLLGKLFMSEQEQAKTAK